MPAPSPWALAADLVDPPPPPDEPWRTSPLAWAVHTGRGKYDAPRHLHIMEEHAQATITAATRLILEVAIRHGKTKYLERFVAHYLCTNPDKRVIWGGHTAEFAERRGRAVRDMVTEHGHMFDVRVSRRSESASRWDIDGDTGGMITVGVGGTPIGEGADLMVIDDPLKGYEAAMSPVQRAKVNEWLVGTMFGRIEPGGAALMALARWHANDPAGFLVEESPEEWSALRMPGFCDDPDTDPLGRELGEALWPERWPVSELTKQRKQLSLLMGGAVWNAQVQQRPNEAGGSVFPEAKWRFVKAHELPDDITWCRGWDLAATEGGGDWTVGVRVGRLFDGRFVIGDVERGQWDGHTWRQKMRSAAAGDPDGTMVKLPQDPGQAGKDQAQQLIAHMAGFDASANPVTGNKEIRANSYAAQQQAGNVLIVEGDWNAKFVSEHTDFPRGTHDDQVDAAATAFNALAEFGEPGIRWLT